MLNKCFLILVLVLSFGFSNASAQGVAPVLKDETITAASSLYTVGDVKGAVKTTAVYIAKPAYPSEAQKAGAEGAVRIQISIDEDGNVFSANAVDGHSLLKTVCEEAARRTKFRIARGAGGNAVKIEGTLIYNFAIQKAGWTRIAYGLSLAGRLPLSYFSIPTAAKAFAAEWTNEREMLEKLGRIAQSEPPTPPSPTFVSRFPAMKTQNDSTQQSATMQSRLIVQPSPTAEQIALSQSLIFALQSRLANDELSLWQFNSGLDLSRAFQIFRNPKERASAAQILRRFTQNVPDGVSTEVADALKNLAANFEQKKRTMESDDEASKLSADILAGK